MTRYLLDTNIIGNIIKPTQSPAPTNGPTAQADNDLFITTLTVAEIRRGILALPAGRIREGLHAWFCGPDGPQTLFAGRALCFDVASALARASPTAEGRRAGRPRWRLRHDRRCRRAGA